MKNQKIYKQHLARVSRSFSYCIQQLKSPEREYIGLSYILCRLIDTVEDSQWLSQKAQEQAFHQFINFIQSEPKMHEVQTWQKSFPLSVTESERLLVRDAHLYFTDLHSMNSQIRTHIQQCVLDMSRGMLHFLKNHQNDKSLILNSAIETNQYCFFVAGIVGELLTLIMSECTVDFTINDDILVDAFHFGLYLQKINLLKDYQDDRDAQRFFFKDFESQISSAKFHGAHSLNYIRAIPLHAKQYRLFCAWSLFLGLASLKWVELSYQTKKKKKIPRTETLKVFTRVRAIINSNELLHAEFIKYAGPINSTKRAMVLDQASDDLWLQKLYSGKLSSKYFAELGLAPQSRLR